MKLKILFLFVILSGLATAQGQRHFPYIIRSFDSKAEPVSFSFVRGDKSKPVYMNHDLSVHFEKRNLKDQDSALFRVRGAYLNIKNDSMSISSPEVHVHDLYQRNDDSLYYYFKNTKTGIARVEMNKITTIYYERVQLKKVAASITALAFVTAFIVAPLVALEHGDENLTKYRKIAYPAMGVMVVSATVGFVFSQKRFVIKSRRKNARTWTIRPGM